MKHGLFAWCCLCIYFVCMLKIRGRVSYVWLGALGVCVYVFELHDIFTVCNFVCVMN